MRNLIIQSITLIATLAMCVNVGAAEPKTKWISKNISSVVADGLDEVTVKDNGFRLKITVKGKTTSRTYKITEKPGEGDDDVCLYVNKTKLYCGVVDGAEFGSVDVAVEKVYALKGRLMFLIKETKHSRMGGEETSHHFAITHFKI